MTCLKTLERFASLLVTVFICAGSVHAKDISGTITTTLTIMDDSKLVGDVTCTVRGGACIAFGASGVTLDLNGYSMSGWVSDGMILSDYTLATLVVHLQRVGNAYFQRGRLFWAVAASVIPLGLGLVLVLLASPDHPGR